MKTIVALVDFTDVTPKVLSQARSFAEAFSGRVILLHGLKRKPIVVDMGVVSPTILETLTPEDVDADKAKLEELAAPMRQGGLAVEIDQLPNATVEGIVEEAQRLKADIIVVGSHHHGTIYDLIVGSVTSGVLKRATCPVLVVPND